MTDPQHRKTDRKRGIRVRRSRGRRRATVDEQPLSREQLKTAARSQRRTEARRRIAVAIVVALLIVLVAVVSAWWLGNRESDDPLTPPTVEVPDQGVSTIVAIVDEDGRVRSLTLLAASDDFGERAILFHPSLLTTLPGFGENLLSNAARFEGSDLVGTSISNLLGIRIDEVVLLTTTQLADAVTAALIVDLPEPLVIADGTAQVVVAGTGPVGRDGPMVARLLSDKGLGDELDLLQRQGAVWEALLAAVAEDQGLLEMLLASSGTAARTALLGVATGDALLTIVPATRIEPSGDEERYQLDGDDAAAFTTLHLPFLQLAEEPRIRVEVLNGNGLIGTTRPVAALLVDAGFRIVVTDNADRSDYPMTLVIAQGRAFQEAALSARETIGLGEVSVEIRQPSGVVDLTIIVGEDLPAGGEG